MFNLSVADELHESIQRLLECAKKATQASTNPVTDEGSLRNRMGITSATFSNWKTRGISKEGAIRAEALFGCSVAYLMTGSEARSIKIMEGAGKAGVVVQAAGRTLTDHLIGLIREDFDRLPNDRDRASLYAQWQAFFAEASQAPPAVAPGIVDEETPAAVSRASARKQPLAAPEPTSERPKSR